MIPHLFCVQCKKQINAVAHAAGHLFGFLCDPCFAAMIKKKAKIKIHVPSEPVPE